MIRSAISGSSRMWPSIRLQAEQHRLLTHLPHDVGPLQQEWSWSTDRFFLAPVALRHSAHLPPCASYIAQYCSAVIE